MNFASTSNKLSIILLFFPCQRREANPILGYLNLNHKQLMLTLSSYSKTDLISIYCAYITALL